MKDKKFINNSPNFAQEEGNVKKAIENKNNDPNSMSNINPNESLSIFRTNQESPDKNNLL